LGLNNLAVLSMLIAAAVHDVGHPGVTGKYLIAVGDELALQYNDSSPLENMHLSLAFHLLAKPENNFLDKYSKAIYREFRRMMIEMVLSTDNDRHFMLMEKVESLINSGEAVMSNSTPTKLHTPRLSKTRSAFSMGGVALVSPQASGPNTARCGSSDEADPRQLSGRETHVEVAVVGDDATGAGAGHHHTANRASIPSRRRNSDTQAVTFNLPGTVDKETSANTNHNKHLSLPHPHAHGHAHTPAHTHATAEALMTANSPLILSREKHAGDPNDSPERRGASTTHTTHTMTIPARSLSARMSGFMPSPLVTNSSPNAQHKSIGTPNTSNAPTANTEPRQLLLMSLALHAADVSNPVKVWEQHLTWYPRLMEEFFSQGDKERELGYPITYAFDRNNSVPQAKFQLVRSIFAILLLNNLLTYRHVCRVS
jgi:hypothetical protein